ncbi:TonB-dependent receptor [Marinobacter sp. M3C]|jgi:vitamin B12 transporter|uniref:TonB-dependent receptor domain-containing protein n=1 Tax=unclassified Marinobacter TaxID=83889 RepID=UPI002010615D|nr:MULTISPECIES: TonB-dependent receptor [unclassified Marinobacter]MCL1477992.1 TonB-dependent receptor [Marinobacter sp.]MCL1480443.1 TonB-dependent receptor [Marinobacter sp.]MCL1484627.1 TonB-dependent receptor [Marinobacter sp.]MCL1487758.1 TonB-dependent receptor [Marinobacter sp.]UQG56351.1 TonB-dependent receptor [Marinobacter sp. M4C]
MKAFRFVASSLLVPFALSPLSIAVAQESTGATLDPIVVTATLGPKTVGESLASVTVISEEEIRSKAPADFSDLLRGQPGINVVGNGSFGKSTSVFTRGVQNAGTVLLIDGVKLHSATGGGASWQYVPTDLIQRVEVVRGPRSSLYGADAMGGVVQAFSLDPEQGQRGWVEAGAGNFDTQKTSAGASGSIGNTRFSLSGLHKESDGTAIIENGEDKGFRNTAGLGRVVHTLDNGGEASIMLLQSEGNTEYEGGNIDYLIRTVGFGLMTPLTDSWRMGIQFAESRDETESFTDFGDSIYNTRLRQARWENTLSFNVHELVVGAELQQDEVSGSQNYSETSRTNTAVFSQLRLNFGPVDAQLSLRGDDNEAYGTNETGGLALGYSFDQSHRVRASYGTAFRAPTFNDLYWPLSFNYQGNPDLEPEKSDSYELGVSGNYQVWFWDLAVYQMDIDNLISSGQIGTVDTRVNVDEARIRGAELGGGYEHDGWRAAVALTFMDPEDRNTKNQLARRAKQTARFDLDKTINNFEFGGSVIVEGDRYDDGANTERLAGFGTLDIRAGWSFASNWSTRLTLVNALDKEYSTAERFDGVKYISAGRTAMLSVRYDIQ